MAVRVGQCPTAYRLYTRSVCYVQRRCSYNCRLLRYIGYMPLSFTFYINIVSYN